MKKVLIITHVESEGPGTLGDFLQSFEDLKIQRAELYNGENLPDDARVFDAIVTMGGPMSAHDEDEYPFLKEETEFLKQAIDANIPILGICLGAQMIARACHAPVNKALEKELGWKNVSLTDSGRRDILFQGITDKMRVFQWHEDTFEIPYGGSLLATSEECPNQAFRYGNAYGLQFHIEVTREMLIEWMTNLPECGESVRVYERIRHTLYTQARMIYANFLWLTDICRKSAGSRRES